MKKIRFVALALVILMVALSAASCGGEKAEKVSVKCTVSAVVDGETKFGPFELTVEGTVDNPPTVLKAAELAFQHNEIVFTIADDGLGFKSITLDGEEYKNYADDVNIYGWYYTANGIEPENGRMGINLVAEGDVIELIYSATPFEPEYETETEAAQ